MINNFWKFFFKKANNQPETIAEIERLLFMQINGRYN